MKTLGVPQLSVSYTDDVFEGRCLFDETPLIGRSYIIEADGVWEIYLHDICFLHLVKTIRLFFEQNNMELTDERTNQTQQN